MRRSSAPGPPHRRRERHPTTFRCHTLARRVAGRAPARYYAVQGDIVGLRVGQAVLPSFQADFEQGRYEASIPVSIRAGRDIVGSGTTLGEKDATVGAAKAGNASTRGNLIAHAYADEISVVEAGRDKGYSFVIIADHGNADRALNDDGSPNTAHSTNPVPVFVIHDKTIRLRDGILADVAPTLLDLMGMEKPAEMTGSSLLIG